MPQGSFDKREPKASQSSGALDKKAPAAEVPFVPGQEVKASDLDSRNKLEGKRSWPRGVWRLKPAKRVAIDWYNTIRLRDGIPQENIQALKTLKSKGWHLTLVSYCGRQREMDVREELRSLRQEFVFDDVHFTRGKTGRDGKYDKLKELSINYIVDDDESVLWECDKAGSWVYPITTRHQKKPLDKMDLSKLAIGC